MDPADLHKRLSQISTIWNLVSRTSSDRSPEHAASQAALVERYQAAIQQYLLAAVGNRDTADDLFQEVALRLVRGDFGKAEAQRGRFRDYLKSSLINLVISYQRKQKRMPVLDPATIEPASEESEISESDREFLTDCRQALLDRAWERLAAAQDPDGAPFHAVLQFRCENPDHSSAQMTAELTAALNPSEPFTDVGVRKTLQRARERFADSLLEELAVSLPRASSEELEQALIDLGLHTYCKRALERRVQG